MRSWDCSQIENVDRHTYRAPHFLMHSCCAVSFVVLLSECTSRTLISMHLHGSRLKHIFVSHLKTLHTHRAMFYTVQTSTPRTGTPSSPFPEPVFQHSEQPCQAPRPQQRGALTEPTPPTENEEEKESWQERDQMAARWDEEQKLGEILEGRRMEGSPVQFEVMQNVPELLVHERMSQGIGVKGIKEKKKVSGWSMEEMKEKLSIAVEEESEEVKKTGDF